MATAGTPSTPDVDALVSAITNLVQAQATIHGKGVITANATVTHAPSIDIGIETGLGVDSTVVLGPESIAKLKMEILDVVAKKEAAIAQANSIPAQNRQGVLQKLPKIVQDAFLAWLLKKWFDKLSEIDLNDIQSAAYSTKATVSWAWVKLVEWISTFPN